jgi:hypothetical protein
MLRLAAAILLIGGPILALLFRSWGVGSLVFGLGAIVLGIRQVRLGEHRSEGFIGVALLLGGTFSVIEGLVRLLSGVSP